MSEKIVALSLDNKLRVWGRDHYWLQTVEDFLNKQLQGN